MNIKRKISKVQRRVNQLLKGHGKVNYKEQGVINFIDIGSASGMIPDPWFENSRYIKNLLCFDPHNSNSPDANIIVSNSAIWKEEAEIPFYIYKGLNQSGSSLYEQNTEYVRENFESLKNLGPSNLAETWFERTELIKTIQLKVNTLDHLLVNLERNIKFDFLKIDAQGAEYDILNGALIFLSKDCLGLQLELFNIPLYKGIKLEPEITALLNAKGFKKVKKLPAHGTFDSQNDFIYLRKEPNKQSAQKMEILHKIYEI